MLEPEDLFFDRALVLNIISHNQILDLNSINAEVLNIDIGFDKNLDIAIDKLKQNLVDKIIISSMIPSEYESLNKKLLEKSNSSNSLSIDKKIDLIKSEIFRPLFNLSTRTIYLHREFFENDAPSNLTEIHNNIAIDTSINFNKNDYVIHENYGLGIYMGLEMVETKNVASEYLKMISPRQSS